MKNFIYITLIFFNFLFAIEKKDEKHQQISDEEYFNNFSEEEKQNLRDLENYESYRPFSYTDATRNIFKEKKYKFNLDD